MSSNTQTVPHLIEQARQGDRHSLDRLLESYRGSLHFQARSNIDSGLRGKAEPSDVVQETLLKASLHFAQFRGQNKAELDGWLRRILVRCLTDIARRIRGKRAREQSLEDMIVQPGQAVEAVLATESSSPIATAERRDQAVVLSGALADLPPEYREVIVLHDLEQLDWKEVALRLGRTKGAVRMLWTRALKQLRSLIAARLGESAGQHNSGEK